MNRNSNKVVSIFKALMLVLFCWGSITIILPDSGKFPQAEPVKWSQEELQHYLLLYKEIILNIESVVGSVTQLKIESVWRMEQDLKIMSDKVRQHQIQMPPQWNQQIIKITAECQNILRRLQKDNPEYSHRAKRFSLLPVGHLAASWAVQHLTWFQNFLKQVQKLWKEEEKGEGKIIIEAFVISIQGVLFTLMRKPLKTNHQIIQSLEQELKELLKKVMLKYNQFMIMRQKRAQQYLNYKSQMGLVHGDDGASAAGTSEGATSENIQQENKFVLFDYSEYIPQSQKSAEPQPKKPVKRDLQSMCFTHLQFYTASYHSLQQVPIPYPPMNIKYYKALLRGIAKLQLYCFRWEHFNNIKELKQKFEKAKRDIQNVKKGLMHIPIELQMPNIQTQPTIYTSQDHTHYIQKVEQLAKKVQEADSLTDKSIQTKHLWTAKIMQMELLAKCLFAETSPENQQKHKQIVDRVKKIVKKIVERIKVLEQTQLRKRQQVESPTARPEVVDPTPQQHQTQSTIIVGPAETSEQTLQEETDKPVIKPKKIVFQYQIYHHQKPSQFQKLQLSAQKLNVQFLLPRLYISCQYNQWKFNPQQPDKTKKFLDKVWNHLEEETRLLQSTYLQPWRIPQFLYYYCKFLIKEASKWQFTMQKNSIQVITDKYNKLIKKLETIKKQCQENTILRLTPPPPFSNYQQNDDKSIDDFILIMNHCQQITQGVCKAVTIAMESQIKLILFKYYLTHYQMLATIVRSFTCSKTNNICKNLVELLQRYLIDTIHRWGRTIQKRLVSEKDLLLQVTIQGIQNDWYYLKNKVQFQSSSPINEEELIKQRLQNGKKILQLKKKHEINRSEKPSNSKKALDKLQIQNKSPQFFIYKTNNIVQKKYQQMQYGIKEDLQRSRNQQLRKELENIIEEQQVQTPQKSTQTP